eukprot:EG_transcript_12266
MGSRKRQPAREWTLHQIMGTVPLKSKLDATKDGRSMWTLGPHCHTLLRGYRFLDPQWEADFQVRNRQVALVAVRVYLTVALAVSIINLTDYRRYPSFHPGIVLYSLLCAGTSLLLAGTFCSRFVGRHIFQLFAIGCCVIALFHCYLTSESARLSADMALDYFVPALMALPADTAARRQAEWYIRREIAAEAIYGVLLFSFNHWGALAVLGINRPTLLCFLVVYVSLSIILFADDSLRLASPTLVILISVLASLGFLAFSILMERLRRTSFLNEVLLTREMQASQMADSMLNHTLKNLLADVAASLEVYLAGEAP